MGNIPLKYSMSSNDFITFVRGFLKITFLWKGFEEIGTSGLQDCGNDGFLSSLFNRREGPGVWRAKNKPQKDNLLAKGGPGA